jgi:DNA-directed RNA polymerase beta' subunit
VDRPFIRVNGNTWDDDITIQYIEIIKTNLNIKQMKEDMVPDTNPRYVKMLANMIFRVSTMFNNSQSKARHTGNGRPIKGMKERLAGKDGQIRNNLMGKRVNQTARTVIGPDPTLKTDEIAIPEFIAQTLTFPERVTKFNLEKLQGLVDAGMVETIQKADENNTLINIKRYMIGTRVSPGDHVTRFKGGERIKVVDVKDFKLYEKR